MKLREFLEEFGWPYMRELEYDICVEHSTDAVQHVIHGVRFDHVDMKVVVELK